MSEIKSKPNKRRRIVLLAIFILLVTLFLCGSSIIAKAVIDRSDYPDIFTRTNSDLLQRTDVSQHYYGLIWRHMDEMTEITNRMTTGELLQGVRVFDLWAPNFRAYLNGQGDTAVITAEQVDALTEILHLLINRGSPSLRNDIAGEMERLHFVDFIGMTMTQAWTHLHDLWVNDDPTVIPESLDPDDLSPLPVGELLTDEFYGQYWRVFRDEVNGYAFAYPVDWTVYGQADRPGVRRRINICNYDERTFVPDWTIASIECFKLEVVPGTDMNMPLAETAHEAFCTEPGVMVCGKITPSDPSTQLPERVEFDYHRSDVPYFGTSMVVYRTSSGVLLNFYTYRYKKDSLDFRGIVDSINLTSEGLVRAPKVIPYEAQPWPPILHSRTNLDITPYPTWTPWPTPLPYSIRTPQATLEGGEFASYWAPYRDPDDGYGFAYPADWVLRSQPDIAGVEKRGMVCNNDMDTFGMEELDGICLIIWEVPGIDPALPLDQAAGKVFCDWYSNTECNQISYIPETSGRPTRLDLRVKAMYVDPPWTAIAIVFRNPAGKLIIFFSNMRVMQTPEAQAIVDSFVLGNDTPIIAPMFEPSKKIPLNKK